MAKLFSQISAMLGFPDVTQIGIDIGASSVKVAGLRGKSPNFKLAALGYADTPIGCVVDGTIGDIRSMSEVVREALHQAGIHYYKGVPANVGIRGATNTVFRRLVLPLREEDEMAQAVFLEAQQHVDADLSAWIMDSQQISQVDAHGQVAIMLAAAKKNIVEDYMSLLKMVGVKPAVFDFDVFAIENSFEHSTSDNGDTVLCLDIGRDSTKFNLITQGSPLVARSLTVGGTHLTDTIAKALNIEYDQAEALKVSASHAHEHELNSEVAALIDGFVHEICDEIKRTMDFFANANAENKIDSVDRVVLSGGGATTRGLQDALKNLLGAEVILANPFRNIEVPNNFREMTENFPYVYSVAAGLALRTIGDKPI